MASNMKHPDEAVGGAGELVWCRRKIVVSLQYSVVERSFFGSSTQLQLQLRRRRLCTPLALPLSLSSLQVENPEMGSSRDFMFGFIMGSFLGFIMLFWIWEARHIACRQPRVSNADDDCAVRAPRAVLLSTGPEHNFTLYVASTAHVLCYVLLRGDRRQTCRTGRSLALCRA
jgi:hypothetical protein